MPAWRKPGHTYEGGFLVRILYSHRIQSRDGQSVHIEELVRAFRAAGHDVLVVGPSFYANAGFGGESRMVALVRRMLPAFLSELAELAYNAAAYRKLRRAAREFRPDLIYERYNLFYLAGALLARRYGIRFYLEVNAPIAEERSRFGTLALQRLAHRVERFTWRSADCVLAVSGVLKDMIVAAGTSATRVRVVPNGIVLERFPHREPKVELRNVMLGFVGFVRPWHGLDAVIRCMATDRDLADLSLTVIGTGPVLPHLRHLAQELGIAARVHFSGLIDHEAVPKHVAQFDIALQPKVTPYASPLKIFDYMAAGCAIVAPDQPNIREILLDGETAVLFDPAKPESLRDAIRRLTGDPLLRARLGAAARGELERREYTWLGNASRIAAWADADRPASARQVLHPAPIV
jgi:glycosyltransferase involved in cell wall biosynthesis